MNKIQLHILAFIFAAFLPSKSNPISEEEEDYYTILSLEKSCSQEEIRKAYKKKSLQYHPDKVAQFAARNKNKSHEEIQADFVKIKEAYEILSDVDKRNAYDVLGPEGAKMFHAYQDSEGGSNAQYADPNMLAMNLSTASFFNKSKLFLLVLMAVAIALLGPILICVKIDSIYHKNEDGWLYDTPWVFILIPIWIFNAIFILLALISQAWFMSSKMICMVLLEVFLALKWDGSITWNYEHVLIPLFVHQAIALIDNYFTVRRIRNEVARMVTISYLEEKILPTFRMDDVDQPDDVLSDEPVQKRYYRDLSEEEKEFINELYIIVNNDDDDIDVESNHPFQDEERGSNDDNATKVDPEIKVLFDIAESLEFKYASYAKKEAERSMGKLVLTRLPFLILLVLQLDHSKGWDWNVVFCTIWIEVIWETLLNCFLCCCYGEIAMPSSLKDEIHYSNVKVDESSSDNDSEKKNAESKDASGEENTATNNNDDQKSKQDDLQQSDSGFTPVSFSPLISPTTENEDAENVSKTQVLNEDSNVQDNMNENDDDDDDEDDEYGSTEPEVMQRRSQAAGRCCNNIFLIIFLSLFLVKLNASEDELDNRGDFSSFWLIFPVLLIAGLILCCCGCCIYSGINEEQLENIMRKSGVKTKTDKAEENQDVDGPEVVDDVNISVSSPGRTGFDDLD